MTYDYRRVMDDVVEAARRAQGSDGLVVLLGAGCSKSAGIPLAGELCADIAKRYPLDYERARARNRTGYQDLMAEIPAGERRDLLAAYIDGAKLNWAHIALACLIRKGYIARVLTPNFDPLVVQACALLNVFPAIYDFAASQTFKPDYVPSPAVYYLHGQRSGFRLLNTERECLEHAEQLRPVFEEAGARRPWIVIGYSGENDPVFEHLLAGRSFDYRLYWVGFRDREPAPHLAERLLLEGRDAFYVSGFDADSFLVQLASRLTCFPPDLVSRPFTHLSCTFDLIGVSQYHSPDGNSVDLLAQARNLVGKAIESIEQAGSTAESRGEDLLTAIRARLVAGDPEGAVRLAAGVPLESPTHVDLASWSYVDWGNVLYAQAEASKGAEAARLYGKACSKYESALAIKPDKHEALNNWGNALYAQAKASEGAGAARLYGEACSKYKSALAIKPDFHEALNNWGSALLAQAKASEGAGAARLYGEACSRYESALAIKPDFHEALNNWGNVLYAQAEASEGAEATRLRGEACSKYESALAIKADFHEALNNWGNVLLAQAKASEGAEAARLYGEACSRYESALAIKADFHEALNNWGSALLAQAKASEGAEAARLYGEACSRYESALAIKPDKHEALNNWGNALYAQAKASEGAEAARLYGEACSKYESALAIKADFHEALNNWGNALYAQAEASEGAEATRLRGEACSRYESALAIKADFREALDNWGSALLSQVRRAEGEQRSRLLLEAETRIAEAVRQQPTEVYNLACLRALQGRAEEARELLFHARESSTLPARAHLLDDPDLEAVRELPWFAELVDGHS